MTAFVPGFLPPEVDRKLQADLKAMYLEYCSWFQRTFPRLAAMLDRMNNSEWMRVAQTMPLGPPVAHLSSAERQVVAALVERDPGFALTLRPPGLLQWLRERQLPEAEYLAHVRQKWSELLRKHLGDRVATSVESHQVTQGTHLPGHYPKTWGGGNYPR
jgi:hypothetical protein